MGLHRLQAEAQDPEVADLMGFPPPTRKEDVDAANVEGSWWLDDGHAGEAREEP